MEVKLDVGNAMEISAAFTRAPEIVMEEMALSMNWVVGNVQQLAEQYTPVVSGTLHDNYLTSVHVHESMVVGRVSNAISYAIPVELGVKPHQRSYRKATFTHPGFEGRKMLTHAVADTLDDNEVEFKACLQRIKARIAALDGGAPGSPA